MAATICSIIAFALAASWLTGKCEDLSPLSCPNGDDVFGLFDSCCSNKPVEKFFRDKGANEVADLYATWNGDKGNAVNRKAYENALYAYYRGNEERLKKDCCYFPPTCAELCVGKPNPKTCPNGVDIFKFYESCCSNKTVEQFFLEKKDMQEVAVLYAYWKDESKSALLKADYKNFLYYYYEDNAGHLKYDCCDFPEVCAKTCGGYT